MFLNIFGRLSSTKMASSILIFYNTVNRRTNPFFSSNMGEKSSVGDPVKFISDLDSEGTYPD